MGSWVGVDLDGTLAEYHGWDDGKIGPPVPKMLARVKAWLESGQEVRIVTARVSVPQGLPENLAYERLAEIKQQRAAIGAWCQEHLGQTLKVTASKDFAMIELWDDRAVGVETNTGERIDGLP